MPGVPRGLAEHRLNVDPKVKPVKGLHRRSAVPKGKAIGGEVARLLAAEFIREIYHSEWLDNVVMVPQKDDSLCIALISSISIGPARKITSLSLASIGLLTRLWGVSACLS